MEIEEGVIRLGPKGSFSSANIREIVDVALRVVFLLFLLCFWPIVCRFIACETSEISVILILTTKITQPLPQVFLVNGSITCNFAAVLSHRFNITKFFQIWSTVTGYDELCVCF